MRDRLFDASIVPAVVIALTAVETWDLAGPQGLLLFALAAGCALPGIRLVRALLPRDAGSFTPLTLGPAIGIGASVSVLLLLWTAGIQNWAALLGAPLLVAVAASAIPSADRLRLVLPRAGRADAIALGIVLMLVPLITWAPYRNVGVHLPEGEAYRAYFTADFIWAMSATSEIAKGDVPPVNPFHATEAMHYYWMAHFLSGAVYRNVQSLGLAIEPVILINGVVFGLAFVAFAYWLARAVHASPAWAAVVIVAGFIANSYEGADMIRAVVVHREPWEVLRDTNIDAVTRWFYKGMAVDGLHRLLLYQPHHLTGYALSLTALWIVGLSANVTSIAVGIAVAALLALGLLFSTFGAVIVGSAVAVLYVVRVFQQGRVRTGWVGASIITAGVLGGVLLTRTLGYTRPGDGLLMTFGLNPVAIQHAGWVLFLSFGPLLLLGVPALARWRWAVRDGAAPAALAVTALAFYFFVDVPDMSGVWVGWRSGHMLLIAFVAAAAAGLTHLWFIAEQRWAVAVVTATAMMLAVPTVAIDVFNAQDIDNRHDGAGFPWTLIITPAEREAFHWIRRNTAPDAVIQDEPYARDPATWGYVSAFAERRMAAGLPISMIPRRPYELASDDVRMGIFKNDSAESAHAWAVFLGIDYVLIGDRERQAYRPAVLAMQGRDDLFETVFANDAIVILKVRNGDGRIADRQ